MPLILGGLLLISFGLWEAYGAPYPMFPGRLLQEKRTFLLTLLIVAISGANFFSVLTFWPNESYQIYDQDPINTGVRGLPYGMANITGAVICLWLLSYFRGRARELILFGSVLMTAGECGDSVVARTD